MLNFILNSFNTLITLYLYNMQNLSYYSYNLKKLDYLQIVNL
jgi:hypothetical protein